ncbi:alcohol dehydrogenase catalytic domain-containing protein [Streptosporangium sp. NPDC023825]|uniref:alcohol dehydrogenase catalytic domain-containing protein n=1 Tax=Streptosporangium sp. NPDC023825 TaxID=3154909 RepID=UPI00341858BF
MVTILSPTPSEARPSWPTAESLASKKYAAEVFRGERRYLLTLPVTPGSGAVGRVRVVGPDSTRLRVGDWVLCDPTIRSRDDRADPGRESGTVVLMGGVGMLGGADLGLSYPWIMRNNITIRGQWMYPHEANVQLIRLARTGLLDLRQFDVTTFDLDDADAALAHAATAGGRFSLTVVRPATSGPATSGPATSGPATSG